MLLDLFQCIKLVFFLNSNILRLKSNFLLKTTNTFLQFLLSKNIPLNIFNAMLDHVPVLSYNTQGTHFDRKDLIKTKKWVCALRIGANMSENNQNWQKKANFQLILESNSDQNT